MKLSHYQTPRTLADCTFTVGYYSPEFKPAHKPRLTAKVAIALVLAAMLISLVLGAAR